MENYRHSKIIGPEKIDLSVYVFFFFESDVKLRLIESPCYRANLMAESSNREKISLIHLISLARINFHSIETETQNTYNIFKKFL